MSKPKKNREHLALEVMLIVVTIALTAVVYRTAGYKLVTLNLFYLPVVLAGFFLGRYTAGILAVLSVISASLVCMLQSQDFASYSSPLAIALTVTLWGAVLSLTALLVGTLSDERRVQAEELHDAYVGVVEVLARYLQGGNPHLNARATRVATLSQKIGLEMKLSSKRIDDIRVAALMQDLGNIEVTTKVINRAVGTIEGKAGRASEHRFQGTDLVHSLSTVLRGAMPILLKQDSSLRSVISESVAADVPLGARILRAARAFDALVAPGANEALSIPEAIRELRTDRAADHDPEVLDVLEQVVSRQGELAAV